MENNYKQVAKKEIVHTISGKAFWFLFKMNWLIFQNKCEFLRISHTILKFSFSNFIHVPEVLNVHMNEIKKKLTTIEWNKLRF